MKKIPRKLLRYNCKRKKMINLNTFQLRLIKFYILPIIFFGLIVSYNITYSISKNFINDITFKKEVKEIGFRDAFGRAFKPMFIGGFLSMFSIFAFLNYVDTDAKDLLNHQYVERQKTELDNEYNKAKQILAKKEDKEELEKKYQESWKWQ